MSSTTTFRRGSVVVVQVAFSDFSESKRRPALIVSAESIHRKFPDVVVCPISSRPRYFSRPGPGDQPLHHWKAAGLRHPSTVRSSKTVAVDKRIVGRVLGRLRDEDLRRVDDALRRTLGLENLR